MVKLTADGHCPVCQGPAEIEVHQVDQHTTTFTCVKHPQFSHRLTLPTAIPLGYMVVRMHPDFGDVHMGGLVFPTPQEAADYADGRRDERDIGGVIPDRTTFAVAAVTLLEDPS